MTSNDGFDFRNMNREDLYIPDRVTDSEYHTMKDSSIRIYAYANRVLSRALDKVARDDVGFALFSNSGILLKVYSSKEFKLWGSKHGIIERSVWNEDFDPNVCIAIGLRDKVAMTTSGREHTHPYLQDVHIDFQPFILESTYSGASNDLSPISLLGGVALISPSDRPVAEGHLILELISNDVVLHMFMAQELFHTYFQEQRGLLNIDINSKTRKYHIIYHNEQLFSIVGIPQEDLYFKRAEEFFDPLPENSEFWDIIKNKSQVDDIEIPIRIHGKTKKYLMSTSFYQQEHLDISGMKLFLSSPKYLTHKIARHVGNNAYYSFDNILGNSPVMQECIKKAKLVAQSSSNVMITGESGTGKDVFAQAIHNASVRSEQPFITLNCGAVPNELLASELFGYEGTTLLGTQKEGNVGKFELADTGTVFLDEVGNMPFDLQAMLLKVIEEKSFVRLGGNTLRQVDVKIISATNADMQNMIRRNAFRQDLYFRLCTLNLKLPPLRERGDDIILLAEHFLQTVGRRMGLADYSRRLLPETKAMMLKLPWYGNVRELQNVIERIVQFVNHEEITPSDLSSCLDFETGMGVPDSRGNPEPGGIYMPPQSNAAGYEDFIRIPSSDLSREKLLKALEQNRYNRSETAKALGISRRTLYRKMDKLGIKL
jgi:transcriptional regulator with PAS, ATPase and Fis domain